MKKFKDLTIRGQKMRIVKDAIQQIGTNKFTPKKGYYMKLDFKNFKLTSIQKILQAKDTKCQCCAKGSLFAACVLNVNRVSVRDVFNDESFEKKKLKRWFTPLELDMVEMAFEKKVYTDSSNRLQKWTTVRAKTTYTELGKQCLAFGRKYGTVKGRLLAILNNILENGEFKPGTEAKKRTVQD